MTKEQILEKVCNRRIFDNLYNEKDKVTCKQTLQAMQEFSDQEIAKERDKAKKLVEAAKGLMLFAEDDGLIVNGFRSKEFVLQLKQSLTEYEKL